MYNIEIKYQTFESQSDKFKSKWLCLRTLLWVTNWTVHLSVWNARESL